MSSFRGNELPLKCPRGIDHGFALLPDVDRGVVAGKLAEMFFEGLESWQHALPLPSSTMVLQQR